MVKNTEILKQKHEELWGWLAKNPSKSKIDWPGWDKLLRVNYRTAIECECFACQAARVRNAGTMCGGCPVSIVRTTCVDGVYDKWIMARTNSDRSRYAKLIAQRWDLLERRKKSESESK